MAEEQPRPVGARAVALDEDVDVADMVGLEDRDDGRRARVDPPQNAVSSSGGAIGSSTTTSPPDSTQVQATGGAHSAAGVQLGCGRRQIQTPGVTSRSSTATPGPYRPVAPSPRVDVPAACRLATAPAKS